MHSPTTTRLVGMGLGPTTTRLPIGLPTTTRAPHAGVGHDTAAAPPTTARLLLPATAATMLCATDSAHVTTDALPAAHMAPNTYTGQGSTSPSPPPGQGNAICLPSLSFYREQISRPSLYGCGVVWVRIIRDRSFAICLQELCQIFQRDPEETLFSPLV